MTLAWLIGFFTVNSARMRRDLAAGLRLGLRLLRSLQRKNQEAGQLARTNTVFVRKRNINTGDDPGSLTVVIRIREQKGTRKMKIRPCAGGTTSGCRIPPLLEYYEHDH